VVSQSKIDKIECIKKAKLLKFSPLRTIAFCLNSVTLLYNPTKLTNPSLLSYSISKKIFKTYFFIPIKCFIFAVAKKDLDNQIGKIKKLWQFIVQLKKLGKYSSSTVEQLQIQALQKVKSLFSLTALSNFLSTYKPISKTTLAVALCWSW
jgi:hypothetical protein